MPLTLDDDNAEMGYYGLQVRPQMWFTRQRDWDLC